MDYKIRCEQLVYGKLVGVRGAGYELIAKSPNITPTEAFAIYKEFNGYRPSATSDLASFRPTYVVRRLQKGKIVFLRLTRSDEKEPGRGYFLQERYIVFDAIDLIHSNVKPWLWLLNFPVAPNSFYKRDENLPSYLQLAKKHIHGWIDQATSLLAGQSDFQQLSIVALHYTLNSRPISVSLDNTNNVDNLVFLAALSLLMPNSKLASTEIYVGHSLPQQCNVDISIVREKNSDRNVHYLDILSISDGLNSLSQAKKSYSNLSWRCLKANDLQLLSELIATVEELDIQSLPTAPTTPLDMLLWISMMPTVGLKIARREFSIDTKSIDDWLWLWRNSVDSFTIEDIRKIFSVLVAHTINDWGEIDFSSWRRLIERMPNGILEININSEFQAQFLELWLTFTTNFIDNEANWFIYLLEDFIKIDPKYSVGLFLRWITKADTENLFDLSAKIIRSIAEYSILEEYYSIFEEHYWDLFLSLGNKIERPSDVCSFDAILRAITVDDDLKPISKFVTIFCKSNISNHQVLEMAEAISEMFHSVREVAYHTSELINVLFILCLFGRRKDTIILLASIISQNQQRQYNRSSGLTREKLDFAWNDWIFVSGDHRLLGAFIFLLGRLERYPADSIQKLLTILRDDENLFSSVVKFMQDDLQAQRRDVQINIGNLSSWTEKEQLHSFIIYLLSTSSLPYTDSDVKTLENILDGIDSLEDILSRQNQNELLGIFDNLRNLRICQQILEHQLRATLLTGNISLSWKKYEQLNHYVSSMSIGFVNRILVDSAQKYFRALSGHQKKKFLDWLLRAPLNETPNIERKFSFLLTSAILENNKRLSNDPALRLVLFREAIRVINSQISKHGIGEI